MTISQIIEQDDLRPGMTMHRSNGTEIPDSMVVDGYTFLAKQRDAQGGFRLYMEDPLGGETSNRWFSDEAIAAIRASTI